ncbi:type II toxin-antitoxin system VapC family toxin [Agrobacterium tumefaciens]|uniref:type II toxin-antitoxin system VapC family toxin n=1 Tax=Agrobacterium tumefaciens TaxID=358 RepID=UPI001571D90C|nr:type II toxin-antitoxin system VapC family toxin [Agrobacterium tumefaciens]NSZ37555.1 type II toxin-antitoxin system VapC family toxin [Agrobacterium tumefaciens]NTB22193.1 type II toxin-antitoxin system VapC family toxin [Agrobacterium tumefaciens]NTB31061.1 type II toxin-antitoxin system VapC family toxin [Agrobacterium tumefaciens]NTB32473.1 type II toxin-antitoxin system VapC family toxin [Agrobacterium tumefaciens]
MRTDPVLLLDTDIVSLMGRVKPPPGLRPWLLRVGIHRLALCYPVIAELLRGAHLRVKDDPQKALLITNWVDELISMAFPFPEMTAEVATVYARMTSVPALRHMWTVQREQKSNRLGHDLMISAVAIVYRMPILTANVDDFLEINAHFSLPGVYHPMEVHWYVEPGFVVPLPDFDADEPDPHEKSLPKLGTPSSHSSFEPEDDLQ